MNNNVTNIIDRWKTNSHISYKLYEVDELIMELLQKDIDSGVFADLLEVNDNLPFITLQEYRLAAKVLHLQNKLNKKEQQ